MGVAQVLAEDETRLALVPLHREGEQPAGHEQPRGFAKNRGEIADIDEDVGRQDQVGALRRLGLEKAGDVTGTSRA